MRHKWFLNRLLRRGDHFRQLLLLTRNGLLELILVISILHIEHLVLLNAEVLIVRSIRLTRGGVNSLSQLGPTKNFWLLQLLKIHTILVSLVISRFIGHRLWLFWQLWHSLSFNLIHFRHIWHRQLLNWGNRLSRLLVHIIEEVSRPG